MESDMLGHSIPKFYGATTIGERGQIVIPADARKDLDLQPSSKILVFGPPMGKGLFIIKADSVAEMLAHANQMLSGVQDALKSDSAE